MIKFKWAKEDWKYHPDKVIKEVQHKKEDIALMFWFGHPYKVKWDFFVIFLAVFNAFEVPIQLAFEPDFMESVYWIYFDLGINIIFMVDILGSFRTGYINQKTGEEIKDPWPVAKHYLKTSFFFDLIASVPFDFILSFILSGWNPVIRLVGLIWLVRILWVTKMVKFLDYSANDVNTLKIYLSIFYIIVYIHCYTCLFSYFSVRQDVWRPINYYYDNTVYFAEWYYQYALILYYSSLNFFGNGNYPSTDTLTLLSIFGGIMGILMFAKLVSDIVCNYV